MKISNEQVRKVLQGYVREVENKKSAKAKTSGNKSEGVKAKGDSLVITARSEEAKKAKAAYAKLPEVRADLVDELKGKIESGDYEVSSKEVADKIIHRAIVDKMV
ncbi:MAG: flagellar biosynthesis anti-sigma factor FlgM [Firmicutes bacterium]|nr:flagellar biosynthesis anti-sigma factor FlgM [Bacillota bacterium]